MQEVITDTILAHLTTTPTTLPSRWCSSHRVTRRCHQAALRAVRAPLKVSSSCLWAHRLPRRPPEWPLWAWQYLRFITFSKPPEIKQSTAWLDVVDLLFFLIFSISFSLSLRLSHVLRSKFSLTLPTTNQEQLSDRKYRSCGNTFEREAFPYATHWFLIKPCPNQEKKS